MPATKKKAAKKPAKAKDFKNASINKTLSAEEKLSLFKMIVRIRRSKNAHYVPTTKVISEASSISTSAKLSHRNCFPHGRERSHNCLSRSLRALAVGMSMNECMAEMYGKHTGCSKGKGGSMHFFAPDKNYWGGHGIVAGQTPLGAGLAFALKYKGLKGCALAFLGDGAVNQGSFMETLNLASLWDLPVVFVIENSCSMGTSLARSSAEKTWHTVQMVSTWSGKSAMDTMSSKFARSLTTA